METVTHVVDTVMSMWAEGTRHYRTSDGRNFAVEASTPTGEVLPREVGPMIGELIDIIGAGRAPVANILRPVVIFACAEDGAPIDLTPLHAFESGISHEQALELAGFTVVEQEI